MFPYESEIQFALELVKDAASSLFLPAFNSTKIVEEKASSSDLVTGKMLLFGVFVNEFLYFHLLMVIILKIFVFSYPKYIAYNTIYSK